tara:strand:+ start:56 stop:577 length:522 start_codon:yes stop_codon:yes gene_type:complete
MDYHIRKSQTIIENHQQMLVDIKKIHILHQKLFNNNSSTWTYSDYNFFCLSSPSIVFNDLFHELREFVNEKIPNKRKWMQCWLNYHKSDEVLDWHNHLWDYHGYISIDPKNTRTIFRNYEIANEIGNIYLGPGNREHKVVVDSEYNSPRVTLGFDILLEPDPSKRKYLSLMPL